MVLKFDEHVYRSETGRPKTVVGIGVGKPGAVRLPERVARR
jgi:hypothetical protein